MSVRIPPSFRVARLLPISLRGLLVAGWTGACAPAVQTRTLTAPSAVLTVDRRTPFLKAHLKSGEVVILTNWSIDTVLHRIQGTGERYDINRTRTDGGSLAVSIDSAVLYETNLVTRNSIAGMAMVTGLSLAVTAACAANPKACFGSCPTFYVQAASGWRLEAEGFSASVAPSLEATDVDALISARPRRGLVTLLMRNEAYETHNIRYARLLAVTHGAGDRVYAGEQGSFWKSRRTVAPVSCHDSSGSQDRR